MKEDLKEYLKILNEIKDKNKRLVDISLNIEKIINNITEIDISKINEYLTIYELEKEAVSLDDIICDLKINLMKKEVDYMNKYNEVITLEKEVVSFDNNVEYPNDYHDFFASCDKFIAKLNKITVENKNDIQCLKDSINSNINRRIVYESFKNNKSIYYYIDKRKKYQEENNMI